MKLLAFSDLHRDLGQAAALVEMSAEADVVIGAGDFASVHEGLEETIDGPGGDRDADRAGPRQQRDRGRPARGGGRLERGDRPARRAARRSTGVEFYGLGAGVPVTPWEWSFDLDDEVAAEMLAPCPEGAVLVLHSPPQGHCDVDRRRRPLRQRGAARRQSKTSAPAWRSAATSTSPGAARARSARPRSTTSARRAPG